MESQYQPFSPDVSSLDPAEPGISRPRGLKGRLMLFFYAILIILILIMVIGVKFSQLNKEIVDLKLQLKTIKRGPTSPDEVLLERLVPVQGRCRAGWDSFQESCYLFTTTNTAAWQKAEDQCRSSGGHLLVINNVEELDYISKIADLRSYYWIGLVERQQEGKWSWVDGTDFNSTPKFWDLGQPDNLNFRGNGEGCTQLHPSPMRQRKPWHDADCSLAYRYICEARN